MRLKGLMQPLKQSKEFEEIINAVEKRRYPIGIFGLSESARGYLIHGVYDELDKPFLILTHNDVEAKNLYEDLNLYIPNVFYFPTKEVVFYNIDAISGDLRWERLKVIREMSKKSKKIIVASIESLAQKYIPFELYKEYTFKYSVSDTLNIDELNEKLIQAGYERVDVVEAKGQFSIRGGIMDIYPPLGALPYRIELFGDEIDSIRTFNTESQRSIEKVKSIEIFPAKEMILNRENI
jgi:transcription-repair coupling factor (superfamily II helicase)